MLIIGNGESRKPVDISKIETTKIGCNAIFRDFNVDYLVCADYKMVAEAIEFGFDKPIYTRKEWVNRFVNINPVPDLPYEGTQKYDNPFHWGSGPYAILLGTTLSNDIQLLGFDLYGKQNYINNVYKGTNNYKQPNTRAVDPRYWIIQIGKIFDLFPHKKFTIYQEKNWTLPNIWGKYNVKVDSISNI